MNRLVVDASVAVKWFLRGEDEADLDRAADILVGLADERIDIVQPPHWMAETVAVLARLQPATANRAIDLLDALEIPVEAAAPEYRLAARLAEKLGHHLFDTLYHALALEHGATLVTADRRYFNKARGLGAIRLLRDLDATPPI